MLLPALARAKDSAKQASQARMLGRHHKGTANITYADGHARGTITNQTWRTEQDNNWRRYQSTSDIN
jgi:prepilin-type processing-associated H-X9-DG protein